MNEQFQELQTLESSYHRNPLQATTFKIAQSGLTLGEREVTSQSLSRLSGMVGIPANFLDKCSPLLTRNILAEFLGRNERQIDYLEANGEIQTFLWGDAVVLPIDRMLDAVNAAIPVPLEVVKAKFGPTQYSVMLAEQDAFTVIERDQIQFGVAIRSSFDGSTATKVTLSFFRPTCTNGAYISEGSWSLPRRSYRDPAAAVLAIGEGAATVFNGEGMDAWKRNMQELAGHELRDPMEEILHVGRRLGVSPALVDRVLDAYEQEPIPSSWGIVNAFSRAANDADITLAEQLFAASGVQVVEGRVPCHTCGLLPPEAI